MSDRPWWKNFPLPAPKPSSGTDLHAFLSHHESVRESVHRGLRTDGFRSASIDMLDARDDAGTWAARRFPGLLASSQGGSVLNNLALHAAKHGGTGGSWDRPRYDRGPDPQPHPPAEPQPQPGAGPQPPPPPDNQNAGSGAGRRRRARAAARASAAAAAGGNAETLDAENEAQPQPHPPAAANKAATRDRPKSKHQGPKQAAMDPDAARERRAQRSAKLAEARAQRAAADLDAKRAAAVAAEEQQPQTAPGSGGSKAHKQGLKQAAMDPDAARERRAQRSAKLAEARAQRATAQLEARRNAAAAAGSGDAAGTEPVGSARPKSKLQAAREAVVPRRRPWHAAPEAMKQDNVQAPAEAAGAPGRAEPEVAADSNSGMLRSSRFGAVAVEQDEDGTFSWSGAVPESDKDQRDFAAEMLRKVTYSVLTDEARKFLRAALIHLRDYGHEGNIHSAA